MRSAVVSTSKKCAWQMYEGQRHRESLRQIYRDVSRMPQPPNQSGAAGTLSAAKLNEMVDLRVSEMFAQKFEKVKLSEMMDQRLSEMFAQEWETTRKSVIDMETKNRSLETKSQSLTVEMRELKDEWAQLNDGFTDLTDKWKERQESFEYLEAQVEKSMKTVYEGEEEADQGDEDEEPSIALEDQLRITEQSAKAIGLLSDHLLSTVWQTCSKNTYGNTFVCLLGFFRDHI